MMHIQTFALILATMSENVNELLLTISLIIGGAVSVTVLIKKNFEAIMVYLMSLRMVATLNNAMILINGHAGQLNSNIQSLIKNTEWALDDVAIFGEFVRDHPTTVRPYNESVLTIISAIRLSINDLIDDEECKISTKGLTLLSETLVTFSQIYRYMPEEHFFMVTSTITTLL